jgi:hypothetical protein
MSDTPNNCGSNSPYHQEAFCQGCQRIKSERRMVEGEKNKNWSPIPEAKEWKDSFTVFKDGAPGAVTWIECPICHINLIRYVSDLSGIIPDHICIPTAVKGNYPKHYNINPSGAEFIVTTQNMSFNIGNAVKYLWRFGLKSGTIDDLKKAAWHINDEIKRLEEKK